MAAARRIGGILLTLVVCVSSAPETAKHYAKNRTHYGNPGASGNCLHDEVAIYGFVKGQFCAPYCREGGKCSTDFPAGSMQTATAVCALQDPNNASAHVCVITCHSDAPRGAQCDCPNDMDCWFDSVPEGGNLCAYSLGWIESKVVVDQTI